MSNLLEKASILLTPTAYDDGKILSVKPEKVLGSELVTNGTFDTDTDWIKGSAWSISGGTANYNDSQTVSLNQYVTLNANIYELKFSISNSSGSGARIWIGNSSGNVSYTDNTYQYYTDGDYTLTINVPSNQTTFAFWGNTTGSSFSIDNVSVKQEIDGDFDFTRNSSATRVNSQGLIEDVQILSSNLVSNGDFSQEGSELITNGDFATDSDWSKGASWSIADGKASSDGLSNNSLSQTTPILEVGKTYKLKIDITHISGTLLLLGAYYETQISFTESGSYDIFIVPKVTTFSVYASSFIGSIDNVSVKEVGQDWTLGTGWSIGDSKAISDATQGYISQTNVGAAGVTATYKVQWTQNITAGARLRFFARNYNDSGNETILSGSTTGEGSFGLNGNSVGSGTFTAFVSSTNGYSFKILAEAGVEADITNISVVEITDDTNLPRINYEGFSYQDALGSELVTNGDFSNGTNGWNAAGGGSISVSNNQLTLEGNNDFNFYARQTVSGYEVGKQYRIEVDVAGGSTSKMQVGIYGEGLFFDNQPIVLGKLSAIFTITNGSNGSRFLDIINRNDDGLNDTLIINSVSVKEVLGQEVVPDSGCGSWLFEPQTTNLVNYSEDYNTGWNRQSGNISDGGSGLFYLSPLSNVIKYQSTSVGFNQMQYALPSAVTIGTTYTQQGYVKCDDAPYIHFQIHPISGSTFVVWDNINNVVVSASASIDSYNITSLNGWIKAEITYTAAVASIYASIKTYFSTSPTNNQAGIPIGTIAYQTFVQVEAQSFATSYIPTNGSTVTRLQDAAFGAGSSDLINSTEGVIYVEISALANVNLQRWISLSDGTHNNTVKIGFANSTSAYKISCDVRVGGVNQVFMSNDFGAVQPTFKKVAVKYKQNDFALWIDGVKVATDTSGNVPTGLNELSFDRGGGAQDFFGKTKCLAVFKEALTDEELTCLTTI
jgi:hypothetical protein